MVLGLAVERCIQREHTDYGSVFGKAKEGGPATATFAIFEALGAIAFSYSYVRRTPPSLSVLPHCS